MAQGIERAGSTSAIAVTLAVLLLPGSVRLNGQSTDTNVLAEPVLLDLREAVRQTLAQDARIRLSEEQVEVAKGGVESAAGQFDVTLNSSLEHASTKIPRSQTDIFLDEQADVTEWVTHSTVYRLELRKQFRSGITVAPGLDVTRYQDNLFDERAVNRANVSFVIRIPLMRGLGHASTAALERAAKVDQEAAVLLLEQEIAERILNTVAAYWTSLAARRRLEVLRDTETQAAGLVREVAEVVRIQEVAPSELRQAEADHAAKMASRLAGEQEDWAARQRLAQALGVPAHRLTEPPVATNNFPVPGLGPVLAGDGISGLLARSLDRRADYLAGIKRREAAEILELAASRDLKPRLDLDLEAGYAALQEGNQLRHFWASLDPHLAAGPNVMGTLALEWPFANRKAQGLLAQREAERRMSEIRLEELARTIYSRLLIARSDLLGTRDELEKSEAAEQKFKQAVDSQREKVGLGTATILDLITLTDRYNAARLNVISARARYAIALAQLRFETGRLIERGARPDRPLRLEELTTLPDWN